MIQLRIRTEYSFGQTYAPIPRVIARLKAVGCRAAGIVDVASTWGHVPWWEACREAGIQPLLGVELIVDDALGTQRMWFLATSKASLSELYRAASLAHRQTVETKVGHLPRLYRDDVAGMSEGIIKFAGDLTDGEFLKDVGAYLDLNPGSRIMNVAKQAIATSTGLKLVATSDNFFSAPEDRDVFEFASRSRLKMTPQYILDHLDHQDVAEELAVQCSSLELPMATMLRVPGDLEAICREGIAYRGMESHWTEEYETRLQYELELIRSKDFESYFIIVADMVHEAKRHMLVGPSRGSAAGSLVCYTARITEIDPIPAKLFFERFIDITRGGWKFNKKFVEAFDAIP